MAFFFVTYRFSLDYYAFIELLVMSYGFAYASENGYTGGYNLRPRKAVPSKKANLCTFFPTLGKQ